MMISLTAAAALQRVISYLSLIWKKLKARQYEEDAISLSFFSNTKSNLSNYADEFLPVRKVFHQESGRRSGRCSVRQTAQTAWLPQSSPGREICPNTHSFTSSAFMGLWLQDKPFVICMGRCTPSPDSKTASRNSLSIVAFKGNII